MRAQDNHERQAVNAAFLRNHRGEVCITFADPAYVRAEAILIDPVKCGLHAIMHESSYFLGTISDAMASAFVENKQALLTALRSDGSVYEVFAPILKENGNQQIMRKEG